MPVEAHVGSILWVYFQPPGILRNPPVKKTGWGGATVQIKNAEPRDKTAWASHAGKKLEFMQQVDMDALAKLLAKVAHAQAVASIGVDAFEHWLPPYIDGTDPALSYLVGGVDAPLDPSDRLHDIQWKVAPHDGDTDNYLVTVRIRLFAQIGGPTALVVVGRSSMEVAQALLVQNGQSA